MAGCHYGTFAGDPTRPELERFFFLDDVDRGLIALRRNKHHQLGFALQMCTVRYVACSWRTPLAVRWPVVEHLAAQLGVEDPSVVKRCTERPKTAYEHAWEIRDAYRPYEDAEWGRRFRTFRHGRAWTHAEGPQALFNQAVGWLRRHRVLLPAGEAGHYQAMEPRGCRRVETMVRAGRQAAASRSSAVVHDLRAAADLRNRCVHVDEESAEHQLRDHGVDGDGQAEEQRRGQDGGACGGGVGAGDDPGEQEPREQKVSVQEPMQGRVAGGGVVQGG